MEISVLTSVAMMTIWSRRTTLKVSVFLFFEEAWRSIGAAWLRGHPPAGAAERFLAEIGPVPPCARRESG